MRKIRQPGLDRGAHDDAFAARNSTRPSRANATPEQKALRQARKLHLALRRWRRLNV
jgi:hypothetical protein